MISFELLIVNSAGVLSTPLPDAFNFTASPLWSDIGSFSFDYPQNGANFSSLRTPLEGDQKVEIAVKIDGVEITQLRWVIEGFNGDDAAESAGNSWTFSGRAWPVRLEDAVVWVTGSVNLYQTFTSQNPGAIMSTLISAAKTRGCFSDLAIDFSSSVDSDGVAWPNTYTIDFNAGTTLLSLLQQMVSTGWCEFGYSGRTLHLYRFNTHGVHQDTAGTDVRFVVGRDATDSPRQRDVTGAATSALISGANASSASTSDASALTRIGRRRETYASTGNISDSGTLTTFAAQVLAVTAYGNYQKTVGLDFRLSSTPQPFVNFNAGDWVPVEGPSLLNGRESLRVKQIAITFNQDETVTGSIVLNSFIQEREALIALKVQAIQDGTTITGSAQSSTGSGSYIDGIAPAQVTGLSISTDTYVDNNGVRYAQLLATWNAATVNTDGTTVNDLNCYRFQWAYTSGTDLSWHEVTPTVNQVGVSPVRVNQPVQARVNAQDRAGNVSAWSAVVTLTSATDSTPPNTPATPTATGYLGVIKVTWNGLDFAGNAQPNDFAGIYVHVSLTNNFTLTNTHTTYTLLGGQGSVYPSEQFTLGSTYYVKVQAFDKTGNLSGLSGQASAIPQSVLTSDLADSIITTAKLVDGAVGTAKLASLAVTTANIANLAVTDAQIGSMQAGKITAGSILADITIAARIKTADVGARVELNASGILAYDSSGNQTVNITTTGNVQILGTILTGPVTSQYMVMGPGISSGRPGIAGYSQISTETAGALVALGNGTPAGGIATSTATFMAGTMSDAASGSVGAGVNAYAATSGQVSLVNVHADSVQIRAGTSTLTVGSHTINLHDASTSAPFVFTSDVGIQFTGPLVVVGTSSFSGGNTTVSGLLNPAGDSYRVVHGTLATGTTSGTGGITVTHGLSVTPTSVVCTGTSSTASQVFSVFAITATTFSVRVTASSTAAAVASASVSFYWMAAI